MRQSVYVSCLNSDHLDSKLGILEVVCVAESGDVIRVHPIMRQITNDLCVAAMMQLVGIVAEHLSLRFEAMSCRLRESRGCTPLQLS